MVRGRLRFADAAALLAPISSATVARLLEELCATGMLQRLADGGYGPGQRPGGWSAGISDEVPAAARAAIDALVAVALAAPRVRLTAERERIVAALWCAVDALVS